MARVALRLSSSLRAPRALVPHDRRASDFTPDLGRIRAPTLLLAADADPLSPVAVAAFLCDRILGARMHVMAGSHTVALDDPDRVAAPIAAFLAEVDAASRGA